MKINIPFHANEPGDYFIGYRTYNTPINTYDIITISVATVGDHTAVIDVPGNLYCATSGIEYTGYAIAACQSQVDTSGDGIPDAAVLWSVLLNEETDPYEVGRITCIATGIESIAIAGDVGCVDATYNFLFTPVNPSDEIRPAAATITFNTGAETITIIDEGLYTVAPVVTIPGITCGTPPTSITPTMKTDGPPINLSALAANGSIDLTPPTFVLAKGSGAIEICLNVAAIPLIEPGYVFISPGNAHCDLCTNITIDSTSATSGEGIISYTTCWDGNNVDGVAKMITRVVLPGETVNIGCVIKNSIYKEKRTLDAAIQTPGGLCS